MPDEVRVRSPERRKQVMESNLLAMKSTKVKAILDQHVVPENHYECGKPCVYGLVCLGADLIYDEFQELSIAGTMQRAFWSMQRAF
eukprot:2844122-Lingulodinium_polyedra.AAC.1